MELAMKNPRTLNPVFSIPPKLLHSVVKAASSTITAPSASSSSFSPFCGVELEEPLTRMQRLHIGRLVNKHGGDYQCKVGSGSSPASSTSPAPSYTRSQGWDHVYREFFLFIRDPDFGIMCKHAVGEKLCWRESASVVVFGSVSDYCAHHAHCSVMIMKEPKTKH